MEERFTYNGCCLEWGPGGHYLIHCECDVQDQKQSIEQCQTRNRFWKYQGIILMIDTHYVIFFRTYLLPIAIFNKSRFIIPCCRRYDTPSFNILALRACFSCSPASLIHSGSMALLIISRPYRRVAHGRLQKMKTVQVRATLQVLRQVVLR